MTLYADFGPMVIETDVDVAVLSVLREYLPTYLHQAETERDAQLQGMPLARPVAGSYANTLEDDEFPDHQMPAIMVTTAQTAGKPQRAADGIILAAWKVRVSAVVRGRTGPESRLIASIFGGCIRRILIHHEGLHGFAGQIDWEASRVARVADQTTAGRYLAAGINEFTVFVDEVLQAGVGPTAPAPNDEPYEPLQIVSDVETTVTGFPPEMELP